MKYLVIDVEAVAIPDVDTYLEPVSAPANYKDADKIATYCAERRAELIDRAALDVDLAQIVAVGLCAHDWAAPVVKVAREPGDERTLLAWVWGTWKGMGGSGSYSGSAFCSFVTFNGLGYDLPLLMRRSLYLGIDYPQLQVDRFKHPGVIDLMAVLSLDGKLKFHGLSFYANRFGLPTEPDITGAEIGAAVKAGDWAAVEKHCACDVLTTKLLAERIGAVATQAQMADAVL